MSSSFIASTTDKSEIEGKGTVFYVPCPYDLTTRDQLVGVECVINDKAYVIQGMEWWCIPRLPRKGEMVGLMVVTSRDAADMRIADGLLGSVAVGYEGNIPLIDVVRFVRRAIEKESE